MEKTKEYSYGIDIMKLICALFVVSIHTTMLLDIGDPYYSLYHDYITRFAVPFFFICSGFFSHILPLPENKSETAIHIKKYAKRLIRPFLLWGGVYFILSAAEMILLDKVSLSTALWTKIHGLLVESPGGGLWYIEAVFWILAIVFFTNRFVKNSNVYLAVFAVFYLIGGLWGNHGGAILEQLRTAYYTVFVSERTFFFYGVYFFAGVFFYHRKDHIQKKPILYLMGMAVFYALFVMCNKLPLVSWVVFARQIVKICISVCWFLLAYSVQVKRQSDCWIVHNARRMSTIIYFTHFLAIYGIKVCFKVFSIDFNSHCTLACILVSALLLSYCFVLIRVDKHKRIIGKLY